MGPSRRLSVGRAGVCQTGRVPTRTARTGRPVPILMTVADAARTVLITGAYGTGKTTLAAEIAELLADRHVPCAAIDLDWLGWFWLPGKREHTVNDIVVANLGALADTYVRGWGRAPDAGRHHPDARHELDQLAAVVPAPLRVLQLTVPLAEIARRLAADALSSRADDLETVAQPSPMPAQKSPT